MEKELIIHSAPSAVEIALMENGKLVELHSQANTSQFAVGDIFLGQVDKLMPGLNAAFIDIGFKKEAFLHYTDLGPQLNSLAKFTKDSMNGHQSNPMLAQFDIQPEIIKTGKVAQVLAKRDNLLVQILKEPISTKGHRLSCELTIPGRYIVLTPFQNNIAVSKKIGSAEERNRLHHLIESIRPKNFGVIVRTAAEGKKVAELNEELTSLVAKWKEIHKQLHKAKAPMKLLSELDKTSSIIRDLLNDTFNKIIVDDKNMYDNIKTYLEDIAPDQSRIIQLHKGSKNIFETFGVKKQIKAAFGKTATMNSGAYLVIEHTEAMHVIDVNSGPKMQKTDQDTSALRVNIEAAEEIARQLRLRDIGGIIIIDFIDMRKPEHKIELFKAMRDFMMLDRSQHTILPLSKFGLMQITRQRAKPEVNINTAELCPSCQGSGKINPSILLVDQIERDLEFIFQTRPPSKLILEVHPYVKAYLSKGWIKNFTWKWYWKFHKWISIKENSDIPMIQYKFFENQDEEIRLT